MKAVIVNTQEIARSPEDVFDYLSVQGNELHWNPDCVQMDRLTDGPVRVGTGPRDDGRIADAPSDRSSARDRP